MMAGRCPVKIQSLLRCSLGLSLSIAICAQQKSPTPGPSIPTTPTGPTTTSPSNGSTFPNTQPNSNPNMGLSDRPLYLTGKVVLEDGTAPSDRVAIQIICRGTPRTIAFTDRRGNFSADLSDRNAEVFADASQPSRAFSGPGGGASRGICPGEPNLMGVSVQADLPGYSSDAVNLGSRHAMDNPDIGTLFLRRRANVEGLTISATSALAPKDAQKALDKGRADAMKLKFPEAEKEFQKAVTIYPKFAAAWLELGNVQGVQKNLEGARNSYSQSLAADPKFVSPYLQLASLAAGEQKWQDVIDDTDRLLHLNPFDFPQAWMFNALANYYLGKKDEAEKSAREGISHDPAHRYPRMNYLLGVLLSQKRDFAASAESIRDYLKYAPNATDADQIRKQLSEVEKAAAPEAQKQAPPEAQKQ